MQRQFNFLIAIPVRQKYVTVTREQFQGIFQENVSDVFRMDEASFLPLFLLYLTEVG